MVLAGRSLVPTAVAVAAAIGVAGVVVATSTAARVEVAALTAVTTAGFLARARWPRMPAAQEEGEDPTGA